MDQFVVGALNIRVLHTMGSFMLQHAFGIDSGATGFMVRSGLAEGDCNNIGRGVRSKHLKRTALTPEFYLLYAWVCIAVGSLDIMSGLAFLAGTVFAFVAMVLKIGQA